RQTAARTIRAGEDIALVTPWEEPLGILHVEEHFAYNGREEARLVYGTDDPRHPGAQYQLTRGDVLLAGPVDLIARQPLKGFDAFRLDPADSRARFRQLGWQTVVGFQSHQPMHRAHEYIQKCALEPVDGLFIHPLVGQTKLDELPSEVRVRCYQVLVEQYYPKDRVVLAVFPGAIRYAGPRETLFHALVRKNYGCTHFIVGREYAGVESTFAPMTVDDIRRFAREGYQSIPAPWLNTYFRWWGAYTQGDGIGAVGGKSGEGKAVPYFMVRIRIPNGQLFSHQLRTIAGFAERSARGVAD